MSSYIPHGQSGLFDEFFNSEDIRTSQKPLIRIGAMIEWDLFKGDLERSFPLSDEGGRPRFAPLLMFKILVLQKVHGLLDDETSFQIMDRRSFKLFLGMTDQDQVPDGQTIADFRNALVAQKMFERLFKKFLDHLQKKHGFKFCKQGTIIDATFVEVPISRNTKEENDLIKAGTPSKSILSNPQKDKDARWTKKNHESFFGYKNHIKVDAKTKVILSSMTTPAQVHDSQAFKTLAKSSDKKVFADSAYTGPEIEAHIKKCKLQAWICEKGTRAKKITKSQKKSNRKISKTRCRVEHVFAQIKGCMKGLYQRCIGFERNEGNIHLTNLVYNLLRFEQILRLNLAR